MGRNREQVVGRWGRPGPAFLHRVSRFLSSWSVPSPPPPPVVRKPPTPGGAKAAPKEAEAEPSWEAGPGGGGKPSQGRAAVPSSNPAPQRAEPSREIRNIIRMYQSRPGPVPVPVQPSRWAPGGSRVACSPGNHPVDS